MWTGLEQCLMGAIVSCYWSAEFHAKYTSSWVGFQLLTSQDECYFTELEEQWKLEGIYENGVYFYLRRDQSSNIKCTGSRDMHKNFWNMSNNLIIPAMHRWLVSSVGSYHVPPFTLVCRMPRYCHPNDDDDDDDDDDVRYRTYLTCEITLHVS